MLTYRFLVLNRPFSIFLFLIFIFQSFNSQAQQQMITPAALQKGDSIAIVATARKHTDNNLKPAIDYGIIHFDSPDKRGIDVALLFQKKHFKPTSYANIPLYIYKKQIQNQESASTSGELEDDGEVNTYTNRVFTRDQLLITGFLDDEEINIIVNHWPSRSGGEKKSSPFREAAGALNRKIIDSLQKINPNAKVITLGDLNDGPFNNSIRKVLGAKAKKEEVPELGIYNPFEEMAKKGLGTIAYRDSCDIFDQNGYSNFNKK